MEPTENPSRELVLARIRTGLAVPVHGSGTPALPRPFFPPVLNPLDRFRLECAANHTEFVPTRDPESSAAAIAAVLAELPTGEIFVQDAPQLRAMAGKWSGRSVTWSGKERPKESVQATITTAEALVAATGSILVSTASGGRGASVIPPVHIVVAQVEQLLPDLQTAVGFVRERGILERSSYLCLITGSSRTADIEKILVLGAHGPRRLVVVLSGCP